jgi:hypothetical protein
MFQPTRPVSDAVVHDTISGGTVGQSRVTIEGGKISLPAYSASATRALRCSS